MTVASVKNVEKSFGRDRVLGPISIEFSASSVTCVRGSNGAGKSTLISILAGIIKPDIGDCTVPNVINYVPQEIALYSSLSCYDNLMYWASVYGVPDKKSAVLNALSLVNLDDVRKKKIEALSGGMKRRVNFAVALLRPAELMLLDEPLAGCDEESSQIILDTIRKIANEGSCVVMVSHNEDEISKVSDRVVTLEKGMIVSNE